MMKPSDPTSPRGKFVLFGDSITQESFAVGGWGARLADHLFRRVDVINRGFSGYNSMHGAYMISDILSSPMCCSPDLVTVFFGANDATVSTSFQHVPVEEYEENIASIVDSIKKNSPTADVILFTPPPVDESMWAEHCRVRDGLDKAPESDRSNENLVKYAEAVRRVGIDKKVSVLDTFAIFNAQPNVRELLRDGLHLSSKGCEIIFNQFVELQVEKVKRLNPDQWKSHYPLYSDIKGPEWKSLMDEYNRKSN